MKPFLSRRTFGLLAAGLVCAGSACAADDSQPIGPLKYEAGGHLFMFQVENEARPVITSVDVTYAGTDKAVTLRPPQLRVDEFQPYGKRLRVRFDGATYPVKLPAFEIEGRGELVHLRIEGQHFAAPVWWEGRPRKPK